jgi:hypothetical protein
MNKNHRITTSAGSRDSKSISVERKRKKSAKRDGSLKRPGKSLEGYQSTVISKPRPQLSNPISISSEKKIPDRFKLVNSIDDSKYQLLTQKIEEES